MQNREKAARLSDEFAYQLLTGDRNSTVDLARLFGSLESLDARVTNPSADIGSFIETTRDLISAGFPQLAERVARAGLRADPGSAQLHYLMALALARLGSSARAAALVEGLLSGPAEASLLAEAHALRGRLFKDSALRTANVAERQRLFEKAADAYERSSSAKLSHFASINTASMRLMSGDAAAARAHADVALSLARAEVETRTGDFWTAATLGEAALVLGELSLAEDSYGAALSRASGRRGDIAAMHRQLRMLARCCEIPATLMAATSVGPVLLYTGHRADTVDTPNARLGPEAEREIAGEIRKFLGEVRPSVVIGSAASGVDIIVLEEAARAGCERHVWLPLDTDEFVARSVVDGGQHWVERFHGAMNDATRVVSIPTESTSNDNIPFTYLREIVLGAGLLEADRLATALVGLAVINPTSALRPGGSADTAARWRAADVQVHTIPIGGMGNSLAPSEIGVDDRCLRAMLFSDMVGYSALAEPNIRAFPRHFLKLVRDLLDASPEGAEFRNTWGDGLFLGFERLDVAARFALDLRERVMGTEWLDLGLPKHTSVRMGMHAGPIFREWDPVLDRENYFGSHVVRAARIEPIAAPGAIWMTEEMACLLASLRVKDMTCEYLGHMPLAKEYGHNALYALERGSRWLNHQV